MSTDDRRQIAVIGPTYCDLVFADLPRIPNLGEEIATESFATYPGGMAIMAVALTRLGMRTGYFSIVGDDFLGQLLLERLRAEGVSTTSVRVISGGRTGVSAAISLPSDRFFVTFEGVNRQWPSFLTETGEILRSLRGYQHVHLGVSAEGPTTLRAVATRVREAGMTLSLDVGWIAAERWSPQHFAVVQEADVFLPNEREGLRITGASTPEHALRILQAYVTLPVMKLGARGAIAIENDEVVTASGLPTTVADTVGAGDAFDAGFLLGWLEGQPLSRCLLLGNICGAYSTRATGGLDSLPNLEEVTQTLDFMERRDPRP